VEDAERIGVLIANSIEIGCYCLLRITDVAVAFTHEECSLGTFRLILGGGTRIGFLVEGRCLVVFAYMESLIAFLMIYVGIATRKEY